MLLTCQSPPGIGCSRTNLIEFRQYDGLWHCCWILCLSLDHYYRDFSASMFEERAVYRRFVTKQRFSWCYEISFAFFELALILDMIRKKRLTRTFNTPWANTRHFHCMQDQGDFKECVTWITPIVYHHSIEKSSGRIFHTPHFPHSAFPYSALSTLRTFHTPRFPHSALRTLHSSFSTEPGKAVDHWKLYCAIKSINRDDWW